MQKPQKPTPQEMKLYAALAAVVGFAGSVAAVWTLMGFGRTISHHMSGEVFVLLATLGAFCAGLAVSPWLGQGGWKGAIVSLVCFFGATIVGAWIAGLLGLGAQHYDLVGLWLMFNFFTPLAVLWLGLWGATHWMGTVIRRKLT
ncbi:hypothetical protein KO498_13630 [Lentibacter algarum]|uniref:hypothetical protein n=1 Tax=Lentibacter algarum TaxID=576131 RepID=UPI001C09E57B|nr:hypothetical protein [Lentibacter algarum]MBU2982853.1 hypothetical protein [Lentibacter algarum]